MKWLPSFVKLFLVFVVGFALQVVGIITEMQFFGNYTLGSVAGILRLLGVLLMLLSPLLIGLKFFAKLDRKA